MPDALRLAELMGALSLATDLGMGQPLEHALRTCLVALALGDRLGLQPQDLSDVYYVALLRFLGCSADAHETAAMAGGDEIALRAAIAPVLGGPPREFVSHVLPKIGSGRGPAQRARLVVGMLATGRETGREGLRAHCELGESLAQRVGLSAGVRAALAAAFEHWNGTGAPNGLARDAIPIAARIVFVARDVDVLLRLGGRARVVEAVRARSGAAYDPQVASAFLDHVDGVLAALEADSPWEAALEREPAPRPHVPETRLDSVLEAFADFVDVKTPFTSGHSRGVAALAATARPAEATVLRRAGLVHDLGRAAVPNGIWEKPGALSDGEWERVRLHAYHSERILERVQPLRALARVSGMHHERQDGSGYHRGSSGAEIAPSARVLAAADAYQAMTQPRPHRAALVPADAASALESMARAGSLDLEAVRDVLTAAGHEPSRARRAWPADLSDREVEVLRLVCRGNPKAQVARLLVIAPSTVDHHVRHIYEKAGVRTRAGATLFALEHDLLE